MIRLLLCYKKRPTYQRFPGRTFARPAAATAAVATSKAKAARWPPLLTIYCRRCCRGCSTPSISARHRAQLPRHEVIGRPRSREGDVAILEMPGRGAVAVLIFQDGGGIDEVGKVDQHAAGGGTFADHVLFQW